jgi:hypothetical protein
VHVGEGVPQARVGAHLAQAMPGDGPATTVAVAHGGPAGAPEWRGGTVAP